MPMEEEGRYALENGAESFDKAVAVFMAACTGNVSSLEQ